MSSNYYNKDIYGDYKDEIKMYFEKYDPKEYNKIIQEDKRTNITMVFSEMRANIIKWYPFNEGKKALEIGANYGEITKELVNKLNKVTVIEFDDEKIDCIRKRLLNNDNYEIKSCDKLTDIKLKEKYDYIIAIGTAEYAEKIGFNDLGHMLEWMNQQLDDEGTILLTIDNRFGTKYLAGSTRNKDEVPFACFKPYIDKNYKLYGKKELENIIKKAGVENYKFYYPVPNYNLTHLIYTDQYLPQNSKYNLYYREDEEILFNELELIKIARKNEMFSFFTNSYLIEITKKKENQSNICFVNYSDMRKPEYKIQTKIATDKVTKELYIKNQNKHIIQINQNIEKLKELGFSVCEQYENDCIISDFITKPTMDEYLNRILQQGRVEKFKQELDKWYLYIKNKLQGEYVGESIFKKYSIDSPKENKQTLLKYGFIDLIFQNVFYDGNEYIVFDQEWYEEGVPLEFIMYRSIKKIFFQHNELENKINKEELYSRYNITDFIKEFDMLEEKWQENIIDKNIYDFYSQKWSCIKSIEDIKLDFNKRLGAVYYEKDEAQKEYEEKINCLHKELENVKKQLKDKTIELENKDTQLIELKSGSRLYRWIKFFKSDD